MHYQDAISRYIHRRDTLFSRCQYIILAFDLVSSITYDLVKHGIYYSSCVTCLLANWYTLTQLSVSLRWMLKCYEAFANVHHLKLNFNPDKVGLTQSTVSGPLCGTQLEFLPSLR